MNVSELIESLQVFPKDCLVITDGYEDGYDTIKEIKSLTIVPNPETNWWNGEFVNNVAPSGREAVYLFARKNIF